MHVPNPFGRWLILAALLAAALGRQAPAQAAESLDPAGPLLTPPLPPGCVGQTQTFTQSTGQTISDFSTITSTLAVAGIGLKTWEVSAHTAISHTFPGDLNIYLLAPNQFGFRNTLTTRNGSGFANVFANTIWTDQATVGVTEVSFVNGASHGLLIPDFTTRTASGSSWCRTWHSAIRGG